MSCSFAATQVERELTSACVTCLEVSRLHNSSVAARFARSRIKRNGRGVVFLCFYYTKRRFAQLVTQRTKVVSNISRDMIDLCLSRCVTVGATTGLLV